MRFRNLGFSGLKVSAIGLGTNQFGGKVDFKGAAEIIAVALDQGINFIDTSNSYQSGRSEEAIGKALIGRRQSALIATKVRNQVGEGPNDAGASRVHILAEVENSLKRLGTDYIDLYQIHRWDPETPILETLRTLNDLVRSGKVRYIGASNFDAWQLAWANAVAEREGLTSFISIQPHYHMLERGIKSELVPTCRYFGIGVLPYFPLAGGFLTGKYRPGEPIPAGSRGEKNSYVQNYLTPANFNRLQKLEAFAHERGHTITELAHAWLLAQPQVSSVISGATNPDHVRANAAGVEWALDAVDLEEINSMLESD
jgi:aryl-alcohol dehydrogenase-like predicted oxidoreductase